MDIVTLAILFAVIVVFGFKAFTVVPQQEAYVVERLGRFHAVLNPGLNFLIPFLDRVAYKHLLKVFITFGRVLTLLKQRRWLCRNAVSLVSGSLWMVGKAT